MTWLVDRALELASRPDDAVLVPVLMYTDANGSVMAVPFYSSHRRAKTSSRRSVRTAPKPGSHLGFRPFRIADCSRDASRSTVQLRGLPIQIADLVVNPGLPSAMPGGELVQGCRGWWSGQEPSRTKQRPKTASLWV
jgi:hypothetical protein